MKIYKSKDGLEFRILDINTPQTDGIVNWTRAEFDWIKTNNIKGDEYKAIHYLKQENYLFSPIPEEELSKSARLAKEYGEKILSSLRFPNV